MKYRFGELAQMQNHLHVVEGRILFFYRDAKSELEPRTRVVIEPGLGNSEQVTMLRGEVVARDEGGGETSQGGAWLEFPDVRLARKIEQGVESIGSRKQKRLGCDLLVEVRQARMPYLGRMVDISMGGARIVGAVGLRAGGEVEIRIMGAEPPIPAYLGRADVIRSEANVGDAGVRFLRTDATARVSAGKLFQAVQQAWSKVPELTHSPLCCKGGHLLEPPLPHMKSRL
jgi:hypothetical protein